MDFNKLFKLLLELHKILLDLEKSRYEKNNGPISNANNYFQLVVSHDDFQWLRSLSALIASLDEAIEDDEKNKEQIILEIKNLLFSKNDSDFLIKLESYREEESLVSFVLTQIKRILD
jgi:hypothetical protein